MDHRVRSAGVKSQTNTRSRGSSTLQALLTSQLSNPGNSDSPWQCKGTIYTPFCLKVHKITLTPAPGQGSSLDDLANPVHESHDSTMAQDCCLLCSQPAPAALRWHPHLCALTTSKYFQLFNWGFFQSHGPLRNIPTIKRATKYPSLGKKCFNLISPTLSLAKSSRKETHVSGTPVQFSLQPFPPQLSQEGLAHKTCLCYCKQPQQDGARQRNSCLKRIVKHRPGPDISQSDWRDWALQHIFLLFCSFLYQPLESSESFAALEIHHPQLGANRIHR